MPSIHLTNGPLRELSRSLKALEKALEAEYNIHGFGGFVAEFEACYKELQDVLNKMRTREEFRQKEKLSNEKKKNERAKENQRRA